MKRTIAIILICALGSVVAPRPAQAKAAYCFKALIGCYNQCAAKYPHSEGQQAGCDAGCMLGYAFC